MRRNVFVIFDEYVSGNTAVYTQPMFNAKLGQFDQIAIQAVADNVSGSGPQLTVQIQHSADGRNWSNKSGTAEIPAQSIPTGSTTALVGTDAGTTPMLGLARLQITLGGTGPAAHLRIHVTQRDQGG